MLVIAASASAATGVLGDLLPGNAGTDNVEPIVKTHPPYLKLKELGVKVRGRSVTGDELRVRVRVKVKTSLRFAVLRNGEMIARAKATVKRGSHLLKLTLNTAPIGTKLRLRVTARVGEDKARGFFTLEVLTPPPPPPPPPPGPPPPPPPPAPPLNAAPVVTTSAGSTAYTEGDPATTVDAALTVSDADDANLESATARVSTGFEAGDQLLFTDQLGIAGSYNSGTGVLTLTGTATKADYQAALRSIQYRHTSDAPTTPKAIRFTANDGTAASAPATKSLAFTPVNDAPVVTTTASALAYAENAGPLAVDAGLTAADPDSAALSGATVTISSNFVSAEDDLAFTNQLGITGSYNDATGTLTLTGTASVASYQTALRSVTYENVSNNPSTAQRTVSFQVADSASAASNVATRDIAVGSANDAPVVTTSAGSTAYTENAAAVTIDGALAVSDADDASIESAAVRVSAGFDSGDALNFVDQNGISGSYNSGTGVLTLAGASSVANYQTALRSITVSSTNDNPAPAKTIEFEVNDGDVDSAAATKAIAVTRVNDAPTVDTTNAALAYPESAGPLAADAGLTVTDPDSTQIQGATVQITANFVAAQDELAFANQLGITGSYDDTSGTLTLTGTTSVANYQAALRAVTYENSSDNPAPATRTLTVRATDAEGATSASATRDITLGAANDAATITTTASALAYTEGDPATVVDGGLTVTDVDDTNLEGAQVRISAGFESADELQFTNQLGISGSYNSGTGVLTLTGTSPVANYQAALRSVQYRHTGDDPGTVKTVEFRADDGDGLGPASTRNINVTPVNDAPTVTTSGGSATFTEGGGPVAFDAGLTLADADSTQIQGATVSISANFSSTQDALGFTNQLGITGTYNSGTGVLTLSGTTSVANYQTALRSVTYDNSSDTPAPATRTISVQATDAGGAASNTATRGVTIGGVNDAPAVATSAGSTAYTENAAPVTIDAALTVGDVDDTTLEGATVRISAGLQPGDSLVFVDQSGISGSYNSGTGVLTLTGTSSVAGYQAALRSITFSSTNDSPLASKTIEFKVNDGDVDSAAATKDVAVTAVNDAPLISTTLANLAYTENAGPVAIDPGLLLTDPDSTQITGATVTISSNFSSAQDALGFVNTPAITGSYNDTTGVLTLTGTAPIADYQTALRSVTYANVSDGPTPLTRTASFQVTDLSAASNIAGRGIAITAVDDPPTAVNDSATVLEDASANAVPVLTNDTDIDGGPKTISSASDPANGTVVLTGGSPGAHTGLTYQPDPNYCNDPPGTTPDTFAYTVNGGSSATVSMTVTCVNDAPVADDETFNGVQRAVGNTAYVGDDPTDGAPDPAGPQKTITGDILAGDADVDGPGPLIVTAGTFATNDGGAVDLQADGDFTYRPAAGTSCSDHSDFFDYTVSDQNAGTPATDVGRVTIEIQDCVWYVDGSAAGGGDGRSHAPYNALSAVNGAGGVGDADASSQRIFLYDGSYSGGLPLEADQLLSGQRHGLTVPDGGAGNVTLEPAAPAGSPSAIAGGLGLATNNTIQGIDLGNAAGAALSGTTVGTAVMNTVTAGQIDNQTGQAVGISGGALDMAFSSVSSSGSAGSAIGLTNVSGTFNASGGTLANATGADVALSGGSSSFTYGGTISDDVGALVTVASETGGTKDFNGTISDGGDGDGGGIALTSNTGAVVRFDGGLTLATGVNPAFAATGGGTVAVTDPAGATNNTAVTTTGTALNIASTSIHADDVTFERIASNGAASGIVLNATGSGGGLAVTGNGGANSGGVIQGSSGPGISLTSVGGGVSLTRTSVTGGQDDGIRGSTVSGFVLDNGAVTNNGNAVGEHGLDFGDLTGTVTFTSATITGNAENNLSVSNGSGTLSATVTGGTIGSNSQTIGNDGILMLGTGTGSMTLNVQTAALTDNRGDHVQMATDASNTVTQNLTVNNSQLTTTAGADPAVLGGGITFNPGGNATTDVTLTNNTIQEAFSSAITIDTPGSAVDPQPVTIDATISGNTIGSAAAVDSGSESGDGIALFSNGLGDVDALIENNTIRQYSNLAGIDILQNDGNGTLDATVRNNTIANPGSFATNGILVRSGLTGGTETGQTCVDIGHPSTTALKNSLTGSGAGGSTDIRVRHLSNTTVRLPGYGGTAFDTAAVVAYLQARNNPASTPTASATSSATGTGFITTASCTLP